MKTIDNFLNNLTMYRLVWTGLGVLALISIVFSATDVLPFNAIDMTISLAVAVSSAVLASYILAWFFGGTTTQGSPMITGMIVFFLFNPGKNLEEWLIIGLIGVLAAASKYILAWRGRHICNPVAVAAVIVSWLSIANASWWVASESLFIFVVILGFLVLRKLHRFELFFSFAIVTLVMYLITTAGDSSSITQTIRDTIISFPLLFLGTIMLTEPMTPPPGKYPQMFYGVLVGVLFGLAGSGWHAGPVYFTPEFALVAANTVIFFVWIQKTLVLKLVKQTQLGPQLFAYTFQPNQQLSFTAGQYLDVSLPDVAYDSRGNRRSFSIASGPHQDAIVFGVKHNEPSSTFKKALLDMKPGDNMCAHYLSGSFTLPKNESKKVLLVAGGIGVTPFCSMLQDYVQEDQQRDIAFIYQVNHQDELVFHDVIDPAVEKGINYIPVVTDPGNSWRGESGFIDEQMLSRSVSDFKERIVYLSGPPAMVNNYKKLFRKLGVPRKHIITDYFSGY